MGVHKILECGPQQGGVVEASRFCGPCGRQEWTELSRLEEFGLPLKHGLPGAGEVEDLMPSGLRKHEHLVQGSTDLRAPAIGPRNVLPELLELFHPPIRLVADDDPGVD